jgi:importin subunit alpha-6/7
MLSKDEQGVKDEAARAIGNALTGGSADQVRILVDAGCVGPLCDFLPGLDEEDAVASAVDGLRRILYLGELQSRAKVGDGEGGDGANNSNNNNLLAAKIAEAGGLSKIQALQAHRNDEVREVSHAFVDEYFGCKGLT